MFYKIFLVLIAIVLIGAYAPVAPLSISHLKIPAKRLKSPQPLGSSQNTREAPHPPALLASIPANLTEVETIPPLPAYIPRTESETEPPAIWLPDYLTIGLPSYSTTRLPDYSTTRLPIIEYHYSTFKMSAGVRMETEWFASQLRWLAENGFATLTASQLVAFIHGAYNPPQRSVALTFDVGASKFNDYTNIVIPALRRYGFHGIFFILASRTQESCADPDLTCWPLVKQWAAEGVISVGSHSWSHFDYQTLTPEQLYFDAARSKALIEEKTGQTVLGLCYPFDSVNPAAFNLLESIGYQFAVGGFTRAERSATFGDVEPYNLPRYYPYSGDYYPIIGGAHGLTFAEMMLGAINQ